jgi:uncharacterized damage-inducible protein DinB
MARTEIDALLRMMRQAYDGDVEHSIVANLRAVRDADWDAVPAGGARSIYAIVRHVAECKWMYDNRGFGDGSLRWDEPPIALADDARLTPGELVAWMTEGDARLRASVDALSADAALDRERPLPDGGVRAARGIVHTMIEHDLYHSGEINHVRSLLQGNDRWAFDPD